MKKTIVAAARPLSHHDGRDRLFIRRWRVVAHADLIARVAPGRTEPSAFVAAIIPMAASSYVGLMAMAAALPCAVDITDKRGITMVLDRIGSKPAMIDCESQGGARIAPCPFPYPASARVFASGAETKQAGTMRFEPCFGGIDVQRQTPNHRPERV